MTAVCGAWLAAFCILCFFGAEHQFLARSPLRAETPDQLMCTYTSFVFASNRLRLLYPSLPVLFAKKSWQKGLASCTGSQLR